MFDGHFCHPLDNLIRDDRLFLLEAILPFVNDNMKAPLAMYIKISELSAVMNGFRNPNYVNSCGLHKDINNQEDILSSLAGCGMTGLKEKMAQLKTAFAMMDSMKEPADGAPPEPPSGTYADRDFTDPYAYYSAERSAENPRQKGGFTPDIFSSVRDLFEKYDSGRPL